MAKIQTTKNGPLLASGLKAFKNSKNENLKNTDGMALCRCGKSSNKPFCDGAHIKAGFTDEKLEGRFPDRMKSYQGKNMIIHYNHGVCSLAKHCTDNSPLVFDIRKRPWIDPDRDRVEKTKETIRLCPSGALAYDTADESYKDQDREPGINIEKNGPYRVVGGPEFIDNDGNKPESKEHYSLCRCGASKNKPFCDGAHWDVEFKDEKN